MKSWSEADDALILAAYARFRGQKGVARQVMEHVAPQGLVATLEQVKSRLYKMNCVMDQRKLKEEVPAQPLIKRAAEVVPERSTPIPLLPREEQDLWRRWVQRVFKARSEARSEARV